MYARVIAFSDATEDKRDAAIEMIRGTVIPMLQTFDGFAGFIALYDTDGQSAKSIILWDSKESADAAEETLAERRKGVTSQGGITIESVDLCEARGVALAGARV